MKAMIVTLALISVACATSQPAEIKVESPREVLSECANYCDGSSMISYRNKHTYFCQCVGGETVVISKSGTIYK